MDILKYKKHITFEDLRKAIQRRKKQIAFDKYPKELQECLTEAGMNPYEEDYENRIEHRTMTITVKE